jgi:hypothetical protein
LSARVFGYRFARLAVAARAAVRLLAAVAGAAGLVWAAAQAHPAFAVALVSAFLLVAAAWRRA